MDLSNWIIVFDLDDTLYPENEYVFSGINSWRNIYMRFINISLMVNLKNYTKKTLRIF